MYLLKKLRDGPVPNLLPQTDISPLLEQTLFATLYAVGQAHNIWRFVREVLIQPDQFNIQ